MADAYIPQFGTKDPDDVEDKNFDVAPLLVRLGLTASAVASATVILTEGNSALVITNIVWSSTAQRVSFRWAGGNRDMVYRLTCRVTLLDGRVFDQSATVTIADH